MSPSMLRLAIAASGVIAMLWSLPRLNDGVLVVAVSEHRSQLRNRQEAERRLAELLTEAIAPPPRPRRPTHATRASIERRLAAKKRRSQLKRARSGQE